MAHKMRYDGEADVLTFLFLRRVSFRTLAS